MKEILIRIMILTYIIISLFTMMVAIVLPFTFEMKDFEHWHLICYPLTLWFICSQQKTLELFNRYFD